MFFQTVTNSKRSSSEPSSPNNHHIYDNIGDQQQNNRTSPSKYHTESYSTDTRTPPYSGAIKFRQPPPLLRLVSIYLNFKI